MPPSHRDITIYAIVVVLVFSALFYAGKLEQTVYLSTIAAITGYVLRDREGYIRRETERQKTGGTE